MKRLPESLLRSLQEVPGYDEELFIRAHASREQVTSIRLNPAKPVVMDEAGLPKTRLPFLLEAPVPWSGYGFYLDRRPSFTFDPLFHAGCYYVQEASSMFLEQAFTQLTDISSPLKVLDLCASPGGKSTHIQSLISSNSLLVSNEVIRSRAHVLRDNIIKWGCENVFVTNNDPAAFGKLEGYFDVLVVDAPCSGSGLFRRDEEAIDEWSLNNVQLCYQRQQRILADALPALKENGLLVYSTCSYSAEEDEGIMEWLVKEAGMEPLSLQVPEDWNIVKTKKLEVKGYRFYPYLLKGEGFFLSCFRKTTGSATKWRNLRPEKASAKEKELVLPWLSSGDPEIIRQDGHFLAIPSHLVNDLSILSAALNMIYAGVSLGQVMKDRLVPEHALALSRLAGSKLPFLDVNEEDAIRYLQRQEMKTEAEGKGWQLVRFKGHNLGWINVLPNRINNYYPKELRILKQSNDAGFGK